MDESSPARLYCLLVGGVLVIAGIIGFFYEASFATGDSIQDARTSSGSSRRQRLAQPGPHRDRGALLIARRLRGAAAPRSSSGSSTSSLCVLGFIATGDGGISFVAENDTLFKLVPVNNEDNFLHLILGITGVIAVLRDAVRRAARRRPTASR